MHCRAAGKQQDTKLCTYTGRSAAALHASWQAAASQALRSQLSRTEAGWLNAKLALAGWAEAGWAEAELAEARWPDAKLAQAGLVAEAVLPSQCCPRHPLPPRCTRGRWPSLNPCTINKERPGRSPANQHTQNTVLAGGSGTRGLLVAAGLGQKPWSWLKQKR